MLRLTSYNQIPDSGKTCKCFKFTTHGCAETNDFRNTSCDDCSLRIITTSESVTNTCRKRDDILQCPAKLNTDHIRARVHTEVIVHKCILDHKRGLLILRTGNHGCRHTLSNFLCVAWTG